MEAFWIVASAVSLAYAALVMTILVAVYGVFTRFERTQVGRQFMLTKASLAVVFNYWAIVALIVRGQWTYVSTMPIRTIICAIIGTIMLRWLIILIRAQRDSRHHRHPVWNAPDAPPPVRSE